MGQKEMAVLEVQAGREEAWMTPQVEQVTHHPLPHRKVTMEEIVLETVAIKLGVEAVERG